MRGEIQGYNNTDMSYEFPGFVQSLGRIESAFAHGYKVNIKTGTIFGLSGQELQPQKVKSGHLVVTVQTPGFGKRNESVISVHQLVAYAKYGRKAFRSGQEIRHLDNSPENNRGHNLKPGTRSQNMLDQSPEQRRYLGIKRTRHLVGKPNCQRKLSNSDVRIIRRRAKTGKRGIMTLLAKEYGVSRSLISNLVSGASYASIR